MITSPKNFIEQFQNFIEHIAGVMKTFLTKEVADSYYLGKSEKASSASLADTATKATQDANGNVIPETYATKSELTSGLATKQPVGDYRTKSELDSIYLGINAKAKSAITADTVESVELANVVGLSVPYISGNYVSFSITASNKGQTVTWTAPFDGLCILNEFSSGDYLKINGFSTPSMGNDENGCAAIFYLRKGDTLATKRGTSMASSPSTLSGAIFPVSYLSEVNNEETES